MNFEKKTGKPRMAVHTFLLTITCAVPKAGGNDSAAGRLTMRATPGYQPHGHHAALSGHWRDAL